ncbi:MAG: hypothetical protein ABIQ02_07015 [Saprospiraceae bacterium]
MKIVLFFSLITLLSIGMTACKENLKSEQTSENTSLENAMQSSKAQVNKNISDLQMTVNTKITETENQLASATEETKATLNQKLESLHKQLTDLEILSKKVSVTTAERWADFEQQASQVVAEVKEALNK